MRTQHFLAAAIVAAIVPVGQATELVYQNTTVDLNQRLSAGTNEIGDEIILGGTERVLTAFDFQYYCVSLNSNEQARIRFYYNDGEAWLGGTGLRPLNAFFDSGLFDIAATTRQRYILEVGSAWMPTPITLPEHFTWSIQFSGVDEGESVGVDLYNGLTVGGNYSDFWYNTTGAEWELRTNSTTPLNFGAQITAVPEPSFWSLCLAGGLGGFFLLRRRKAQ